MIRQLRMNTRLFFRGAVLSYIALFAWLRPTTYLASKVVGPLMQILFFSLLGSFATGPETVDFYVVGNAVQVVALSGIFGVTMSIAGDRWSGTLPYLFGTPANRLSLFIGRAIVHVLDGMISVFVGLAWGALLLGLDLSQTDPTALLLTILVTSFSTSGLGLLLGSLSLITVNVMFVNNMMYFMLLIFSGSNVELSLLPAWMQTISNWLPLTRGIAAARRLIEGGSLQEVAPLLNQEVMIGAVYILVGYLLFRWFEGQARQHGTLEKI